MKGDGKVTKKKSILFILTIIVLVGLFYFIFYKTGIGKDEYADLIIDKMCHSYR